MSEKGTNTLIQIELIDYDSLTSIGMKVTQYVNSNLKDISPPKYSSFNKRNIMFGYVVQDINIPNNTIEIERLQKTMIDEVTSEGFILNNNSGAECYIYSCKYTVNTEWIELRHLFYDFSDCISS